VTLAGGPAPPRRTEVAPGIFLFQTEPYGDVGLDGNSIAIVSNDGVLVFDANGTPAAALAVLAQIRRITRRPVRYLVYSHWHWDHWYGAQVYADSFPGLVIISHEKTRALMSGPAIAFNQPALDRQLPDHIREVESRLEKAKAMQAPPSEVARLSRHLASDEFFLAQKRSARHPLATLTFTDSVTLQLGEREIHVLHIDRGVTPGDAFLFLPRENLVVSGDQLINPITYALFCYPSGWIRSLEWIDALDATVLIPGHGAALRDENLLHATLDLLRRERELAREQKSRGAKPEAAKKAILDDQRILGLRDSITASDSTRYDEFGTYLVDWFVRRVYAEDDGALSDSIPTRP